MWITIDVFITSVNGWEMYDAEAEYWRLGLEGNRNFRITRANVNYALCPSYPSIFVVPAVVTDEQLARVSSFREKGRVCLLAVICWERGINVIT